MATYKKRVELLESEVAFRMWLFEQRFLERLSMVQVEKYLCLGILPDPLPAPLPKGNSKLDGLGRKRLIEMWKEYMRPCAGRSEQECRFFGIHGHWPEQACNEGKRKRAKFEKYAKLDDARKSEQEEFHVLAISFLNVIK